MSILIKGMEMPKKCEQCWFFGSNSARVRYCYLLKGELPLPDGVPQDCPLVAVPDHGRLIDADVVEKEIERYEKISGYPVGEEPKEFTGDDGWETVRYTAWMARFFIAEQNAPTIIPADKEEE